MSLMPIWYPLQLLIRKWEVVAPLVCAVLGALLLGVFSEFTLQSVPQPVFLHYSVELGVDSVGSRHFVLTLPSIVLIITFLNALLANLFILNHRAVALVLVWNTPVLTAFAWGLALLILRVNGV